MNQCLSTKAKQVHAWPASAAQALGRPREGYGTTACTVRDAHGRPRGLALIAGQAPELRLAPELLLLAAWLGTVRRVIGDAAYSFVAWFALMEAGVLPPRCDKITASFSGGL